MLTGKVRRGEKPPSDSRLSDERYATFLTDERFDKVERLQKLAESWDVSLLEIAIGGLASRHAVASVIAGATKPEQVRANAAAGAWSPDREQRAQLKEAQNKRFGAESPGAEGAIPLPAADNSVFLPADSGEERVEFRQPSSQIRLGCSASRIAAVVG